ncbi:MAG TPA: hypothetical protein VHD33_02680 [Legionellaceae bacterium]|nr:hypothetical protein [Legionellaceae bacterium]
MNTITLQTILTKNAEHLQNFQTNALMHCIQSTKMQDSIYRERLLDGIQVLSNYFQKIIMLRSVLTENTRFLKIAQIHLTEEFGHNISLMKDRHQKPPIWDAVLEGCCAWFAWKMFTLDDVDRTLLVHLVLESSANLFFHQAHQIMTRYGETNYFKLHSDVDEHHEALGITLLKGLNELHYLHLLDIQQQGWDMLNTICRRIAELALNDNH